MSHRLTELFKRKTGAYLQGWHDTRHALRQLGYIKTRSSSPNRSWRPTQSVPFGMAMGLISILIFSVAVPLTAAQTPGQDCDDNAVIRCGVSDLNDLKVKYRENQQGNVQAVFAAFSIPDEAALEGMVAGRVTASNEVYVGDRLVATNATTAGRQNISNERGSSVDMGGGFWQRSPSVSFADQNGSLDALVKMENNTFKHAVIMSCGNPVGATPVAETPPPTPAPTPPVTTPTPTPTPRPPAMSPEQEQPEFEINKDVRIKGQTQWQQHVAVDEDDGDRLEYRITVSNTGQTALKDVVITDKLPAGISYTDLRLETVDQPSGELFGSGITVDSIGSGQDEEIIYELVINPSVEACNSSRLRNVARAKPNSAVEKEDDATVEVCREQENPTPVAVPATSTPQAPVLAAATTKATLPDTGPASLFAFFSVTSLSGTVVHHAFSKRRKY